MFAILLTWPIASQLSDVAVGSPAGDIAKHLWTLWWMRREVLAGTPGIQTVWVGWPFGMALWPIEPLNGLLTVFLPFSPVVLSNLLALLHLTLLGVCTGWLGALVARRGEAAYVAGALAQASSFAGFTLALGAGELRAFWILPLGLACLVRAQETGQLGRFAGFGLVLGVGTLACFYHGFFLAVAAAVLLLARPRLLARQARGVGLAAAIAVLVAVPPSLLFSASYHASPPPPSAGVAEWLFDPAQTPRIDDANDALNLDQLLIPPRAARTEAASTLRAYNGGRYLGVVATGLALLGAWADRRRAGPWALVAAVGLVLACGNVLMLHGAPVRVFGARLVMPGGALNRVLSHVLEPINFPARFLALTTVGGAVLAGLGSRSRWVLLLLPLAVVDTLHNDIVEWPRPVFALPDVTGLRSTTSGAVANMTPFAWTGGAPVDLHREALLLRKDAASRTRAIAAQIALDAPFEITPIERLDYWFPDGLLWLEALPMTKALGDPQSWNQDFRADEWLLHRQGFDRILLTFPPDQGVRPEIDRLLTRAFGEPIRSPCASVWLVPDFDATNEQARVWSMQHRARLADVPRPNLLPPLRTGLAHPAPPLGDAPAAP